VQEHEAPARVDRDAGWNILHFDSLSSTTTVARQLPAWHAVTASEQTAGRGQYDRSFVSDPGGLYVSAVVPTGGDTKPWVGFSLVVGWALLGTLRRWHVHDCRLRWPNDLMVGARKLGGILIEQASPDTLVVGVGINLLNAPWRQAPELEPVATRVADHTGSIPAPERAAGDVLRALRIAHHEMRALGLAGMQQRLNTCWGSPTRVELDLGQDRRCEGRFGGVDNHGRLLVWTDSGDLRAFAAHHVRRLREIPEVGGSMYSRAQPPPPLP
jgi:BirA family biotin operon repressor/biotin-[acetyl-CoA-carboxylase] ligase